MIKLRATTDKAILIKALDILDIQGIKTRHTDEYDDFGWQKSVLVYSIFVNEEDAEKANAALAQFMPEAPNPEEIDYSKHSVKELFDDLLYKVQNDKQKENIIAALNKKGVDKETVERRLEEEMESGFGQRRLTKEELYFGFANLLLFGLPAYRIGSRIYYAKIKHHITKQEVPLYDRESRKYALIMMVAACVIFLGVIIYVKSIIDR